MLIYDETTGKYRYQKNGEFKYDMLNGNAISYTNVFILFADTTTYENATAKELVINTTGSGKGYYISKGRLTEFNWCINNDGNLIFKDLMGEILTVNAGNSYLSYFKASEPLKITVS